MTYIPLCNSRNGHQGSFQEDELRDHATNQETISQKGGQTGSSIRRFMDACADRFRQRRHGTPAGGCEEDPQCQSHRGRDAAHSPSSSEGSSQVQEPQGRGGSQHVNESEPGRDKMAPIDAHQSSNVSIPLSPTEVRSRIRGGNERRKHMKRGVIKRCYHNAKQILMAMCLVAAACVGSSAAAACKHMHNSRPDCFEIFSGSAEVSWQFARWGWSPMEPVDILYGMDLYQEESRQTVLNWIKKFRPRLVLVSYPCKWWSPINHIACSDSQAKRRLRKKQLREKPLLEFTEELFDLQLSLGGGALGENPLSSMSSRATNQEDSLTPCRLLRRQPRMSTWNPTCSHR